VATGKTKPCKVCGKQFKPISSAKCCSPACRKENELAAKRKFRHENKPVHAEKKCDVCGKPFIGHPKALSCSQACREQKARVRGNEHYRAKQAKQAADPARLDLIRQADARVRQTRQERDPVEVMGDVARRERAACGED
jgi:hypothetical protein